MRDGIPYDQVPAIITKAGGSITVNPLAKWGQSRIWRAVKKAEGHGLVAISRVSAGEAIVTLPEHNEMPEPRS